MKNDSMEEKKSASFEIPALFIRLYSLGNSAAILNLAEFLRPSSSSYRLPET